MMEKKKSDEIEIMESEVTDLIDELDEVYRIDLKRFERALRLNESGSLKPKK